MTNIAPISKSLPLLIDAEEAIEHYNARAGQGLTDAERAYVVSVMTRDGYSNARIRKALGIQKVYVVTHLKRAGMRLEEDELRLWFRNPSRITLGHVRAIAKLPYSRREPLLRSLLSKRIPVSELEALARGEHRQEDVDIAAFEQRVGEVIGRPLTISYNKAKRSGKVTASFFGLDDLDRLLGGLGYRGEDDSS
jgi:ParB family chromosome partitioning protein